MNDFITKYKLINLTREVECLHRSIAVMEIRKFYVNMSLKKTYRWPKIT